MPDLSRLPQVDAVLRAPTAADVLATHGRAATIDAVRTVLEIARRRALEGAAIPSPNEVIRAAGERLERERAGRLRPVINATGVVLHTNLGRAPLSSAATDAAIASGGYADLELDLATGERGSRTAHVGALAAEACGAESATVVNNGAAGLVLALAALSARRHAIVSRGELIEIGGSFRLPDVMGASGAELHEVGTTNRTRIDDYERALSGSRPAGVILKVHRSNYRVVGFTSEPAVSDLAGLAREHGVPFIHDIGSGLLRPVDRPQELAELLAAEPDAATSLEHGADLVIFSGDKLLGGPQAGVIAGRGDLVRRCARHPLARALRLDKLRRAALEATLEAHLRGAHHEVPTWSMLAAPVETLRGRAERLAVALGPAAEVRDVRAVVGGGSAPGGEIGSVAVAIAADDPDALAASLRRSETPIVSRIADGVVLLDLRTIPEERDEEIIIALRRSLDRA